VRCSRFSTNTQIRVNRPMVLTRPRSPPSSHLYQRHTYRAELAFASSALLKPARTGDESVDGRLGWPELGPGPQAIPQKIDPPGRLADKAFLRMDAELEVIEHRFQAIVAS